jgi:hypothetical protein
VAGVDTSPVVEYYQQHRLQVFQSLIGKSGSNVLGKFDYSQGSPNFKSYQVDHVKVADGLA